MNVRRKNNLKGPGPGRPKGLRNKITRTVQDCILEAFHSPEIGGVEGMITWGKRQENRGDFYKHLLSKLLPKNPALQIGIQVDLSDRLNEARTRLKRIEEETIEVEVGKDVQVVTPPKTGSKD